MYRICFFILPAIMLIAAACSSTSNTTRSPEAATEDSVTVKEDSSAAPSWFNKESSVTYENNTVSAYAAAIGSDSASAESKAVSRAMALLKQSVSGKVENLRSDGLRELGDDSGLDDAGFLIDIRKADENVKDIISTEHTDTKAVDDQNSVQGLVEVQLSKEEFVEQMDERLSAHQEAWNALKESEAFQEF